MALSNTRQSALFGINDWKTLYRTFSQADFTSYDYETLRKSFIDYLRVTYPETFNDYVESSEFISLLDVIAFMGQGLAFRNDLNTRENFLDTAERRDSVIKLANLVGYTPKRNIAASGYIKVVSLSTTENIYDINGVNLGGATILWNDPANANWLMQFNTIINATLISGQRIGRPGNTSILLDVKTDEYTISIPTTVLPIVNYESTVDNVRMAFELVSGTALNSSSVYELPPLPNGRMNVLYRNDKNGYGSPNTGFFFYFKQGALQQYDFVLNQQISNQTIDIGTIEGVNNSDTWLFQFDSNGVQTTWTQVETVYGAIAQSSFANPDRKIFSVNSRFNDAVSYTFGDGVFSQIPIGTFRAWVRSSNGLTYTIDPSEMGGVVVTLPYINRTGKPETLSLTLQLTTPVSNAKSREEISDIKLRAPTRFYTQNRMVNGEDYSNFPYTLYGSIIKSRALNRSSIGVSKSLDLVDPTQKYSSATVFGSDGALWQDTTDGKLSFSATNVNTIIQFLSGALSIALGSSPARQYYSQKWSRYASTGGTVYWQTATVSGNTVTGYFYQVVSLNPLPVPVSVYSTSNTKYITAGALIKVRAPLINGVQYYFDPDNRLTTVATAPNRLTTWTAVSNVSGDGSNFGRGVFPNGTGPITLNGYLPSGVSIESSDAIIPVFSNTFSAAIIQDCVNRIEANQNFSLVYNNSLLINQERWSVGSTGATNSFVEFTSLGGGEYLVTYKSLTYYFGSIADTRFAYNASSVYDPRTGTVLKDLIKILGSNPNTTNGNAIGADIRLDISGQKVESDGYVNDYQVTVAYTDPSDPTIITNPDFFTEVVGYDFRTTAVNSRYFVFFQRIQNTATLSSYQILSSTDVVYTFGTLSALEQVKYDYPVGQLFYAWSTGIFYKSVQAAGVITPSFTLVAQTVGDYLARAGRSALGFQYRHNSDNTTRLDPGTTNIIDLYVVTSSYYTQYVRWIQDTSGTVVKPLQPTIAELNATYNAGINTYKMISDSVIFNSVTFKPLFGAKAAQELRATIKVIKNATTNASDSEIRSAILTAMNTYFSIDNWNFGDTFYFSELASYLHRELNDMISSVVLVPLDPSAPFGTLYEVRCAPHEIFVNGATAQNIAVITALTPNQLQMI